MTATDLVRKEIRSRLTDVALPDSRYHLDFAEFIPDFIGSDRALARVCELPCYRAGRYAFVTPDNCLTELRARMLRDGKSMVVSTYGIYRGFVLLEPGMVPEGQETFAAWLDGLEHFGRAVTLAEVAARGAFDFMVTGASAVSLNGVRFGKGHGFFDLEWGMFTDLGVADERTPVVAVVHDSGRFAHRADRPVRVREVDDPLDRDESGAAGLGRCDDRRRSAPAASWVSRSRTPRCCPGVRSSRTSPCRSTSSGAMTARPGRGSGT